jgi:TolB-like protein
VFVIPNDQRLDGWKAIANFLGRERTTAIRWANERGLPIHRVPGGRTGTVYAIRAELDAWMLGNSSDADNAARPDDRLTKRASTNRLSGAKALAAVLIGAVALIVLLAFTFSRTAPSNDAPVTVTAVASPTASRETQDFARSLNADLARFANASPDLAVFEREPGTAAGTQYAVRTEIERANGNMIANARVIALPKGEVLWSRRFEQTGPAVSLLREQVAANIVWVLRCSFGELEKERPKATPGDLAQLMAICQDFEQGDLSAAHERARKLTISHPDLGLAWAILAKVQGDLIEAGDQSLLAQASLNARRALAIAPDSVCSALAFAAASGDGAASPKALPIVEAALRTHPDHPWLQNIRSVILFNLGYVKNSVEPALSSVRDDPSSFGGRDIAVRRLAAAGQIREALQLQAENERLWPGHPLAIANRARITMDTTIQRKADSLAILENEREFANAPSAAFMIARLFERAGNRRAALEWLARAPVKNAQKQWSLLFWPDAAGLRTESAFFRKMVDLGLVRWWIARKQWPDFCAEPGLKYNCVDEARKLHMAK